MDVIFVGREKERAILEKAMTSGEAEMVAVIGRRRIGKTFLVRSVYGDQIDFEITGSSIWNLLRITEIRAPEPGNTSAKPKPGKAGAASPSKVSA